MLIPPAARRYYARSALLAKYAADEAAKRPQQAADVVARFQVMEAHYAEAATAVLVDTAPDATLVAASFTSERREVATTLSRASTDAQFRAIVASLVTDAARAAQSVSTATRPRTGWVRLLAPPSCSRCAVLAGRVYRYSTGFQRHPGCDCVMIPASLAGARALVPDVEGLARSGQITDLSKADRRAIEDGADLGRVINVRRDGAGLRESGRVLYRADRMTPEAIYRSTSTREEALGLLQANGYIR